MHPDVATLTRLYDATKPPSVEMVTLITSIVRSLLQRGTTMQVTDGDQLLLAGVTAVLDQYTNIGDNLFARVILHAHSGIMTELDRQKKERNGRL